MNNSIVDTITVSKEYICKLTGKSEAVSDLLNVSAESLDNIEQYMQTVTTLSIIDSCLVPSFVNRITKTLKLMLLNSGSSVFMESDNATYICCIITNQNKVVLYKSYPISVIPEV